MRRPSFQRCAPAAFAVHGRGLGLIVSHVSLERLGGEISLKRRPEGGTRTQVVIPLSSQTARS